MDTKIPIFDWLTVNGWACATFVSVNPKNPPKRALTAGVEQRDQGADAMRMAPGVPIRMVLGVVEHICAIKPARMCRRHAGRDVTYDSRRTRFTGARGVDRRRRRAGRASFAKKKPDLACRGRDLSPDVRRCAWCGSWEMGVPPGGASASGREKVRST